MNIKQILLTLIVSFILTSCAVQLDLTDTIFKSNIEQKELPLDYLIVQPSSNSFSEWQEDISTFNESITPEILSYELLLLSNSENGVDTAIIHTVRSHVSLDNTTIVKNLNEIYGNWITVSNRGVVFIDSISEDKIYRNKPNEIKINKMIFLKLSSDNYSIYEQEEVNGKFKQITNRGYNIINDKYLVLGGLSMHMPEPFIIGMDNDGRLIICRLFFEIKREGNDYIRYKTIIYEKIFEKVEMDKNMH